MMEIAGFSPKSIFSIIVTEIYSFVLFWGGTKSHTQSLSLSLPAIYLAQVHCGNYNNFTSQLHTG